MLVQGAHIWCARLAHVWLANNRLNLQERQGGGLTAMTGMMTQ